MARKKICYAPRPHVETLWTEGTREVMSHHHATKFDEIIGHIENRWKSEWKEELDDIQEMYADYEDKHELYEQDSRQWFMFKELTRAFSEYKEVSDLVNRLSDQGLDPVDFMSSHLIEYNETEKQPEIEYLMREYLRANRRQLMEGETSWFDRED